MVVLLVKNGKAENAIIVESIEAFQIESPDFFASFDAVVDVATVEPAWIGWTYDGQTFSPPTKKRTQHFH